VRLQPKQHDWMFELTEPGAKCGWVLVAFLNLDRVISIPEVQFCDDRSSAQPVKHVLDQCKWISVLNRGSIESSVVHTQS